MRRFHFSAMVAAALAMLAASASAGNLDTERHDPQNAGDCRPFYRHLSDDDVNGKGLQYYHAGQCYPAGARVAPECEEYWGHELASKSCCILGMRPECQRVHEGDTFGSGCCLTDDGLPNITH